MVTERENSQPSPEPNSVSLVRRYQDGDEGALNALLTRYYPRVERIVRARLGPRLRAKVEVQDVAQGAMIRAIKHIQTFEMRDDASLINWMARLVENEILGLAGHYGAQKRNTDLEEPLEGLPAGDGDSGFDRELARESTSPGSRVARRELEDIVDECLAQLPEKQREVILLRDYTGGSWEFVAESLGSPSGDAARQFYRRARIELATLVQQRT
jgi:RNA polymerase sigma-70 factor (ECF subfamily)